MLGLLAMGEPARKLEFDEPRPEPTFEELWKQIERLPEGVTGEILDPGIVYTMPRPLGRHRRAARNLQDALRGLDAGVGGTGWWIEQEPDVRFGDRTTAPDIAGWRVERCPEAPEGSPILLRPDFCCEVLSHSTARKDRKKKLPLYARFGVEWIWIIDPDLCLVEVYQSVNGHPLLLEVAEENDRMCLPPFDIAIDFSPFWAPSARMGHALDTAKPTTDATQSSPDAPSPSATPSDRLGA